MIAVTMYIEPAKLMSLREHFDNYVTLSLVATESKSVALKVPYPLIKNFDKANEQATVSIWDFYRTSYPKN